MPVPRRRSRGEIEELPSGSLRVRVYAGIDPFSGKRHYLQEIVPGGARSRKEAEKVRIRLCAEIDDKRSPRTSATVNQLLDRYLEVLEIEDTTRAGYEGMLRLYIRPMLGEMPIGRIDGETLDSFYAELRRCRSRCDRRAGGPHVCKPLGASYLRQIHTVLNGAFTRAVRWRWVGVNPVRQAEPPPQPAPDPQPPTAVQAATIVEEAWLDPDWGMFVWLAMTTGARRGELCALRWDRLDFAAGVVDIRSAIAQVNTRTWEKDTKTHQRRRIVVDDQTVTLLTAYLQQAAATAASIGVELAPDSFVFSPDPDRQTWINPDTVTQRYSRMCKRLGWNMHIHQLRHYSATELIAAGVDVRTVAGRLGHSGGGTTTLRVYTAWVAEADQRAATSLAARMPAPPAAAAGVVTAQLTAAAPVLPANAPYLAIAADLRAAIRCGALGSGDALPTLKSLAVRYKVSEGTAHRAVGLLVDAGEVLVARGRRSVVATGGQSAPITE